jgi:chromosome condensin MukBEF ATPase and DNA-binding subunit MukB
MRTAAVIPNTRLFRCCFCSVRAEAASALRDAARRLAEAEAQIMQLKGDLADLQQELEGRPTQQEHR